MYATRERAKGAWEQAKRKVKQTGGEMTGDESRETEVLVGDERLDELLEKRQRAGLSRDEADELGRLLAEREGRPYHNADDQPTPMNQPRHPSDDRTPHGPKADIPPG